jgi:ABC-2 type transport system ATP-binding protein
VGPNGAGKSTLLKCLAGLLQPKAGQVKCGEEIVTGQPQKAAQYLCLMPDPLGVYTDISAREYLEFFARAFAVPPEKRRERIQVAVERMGLQLWLDHEVETLSAGWQRRLALGRTLLADAPIVLLDEPAAGLDVAARSDLLDIVRSLAHEGRTVLVTSHILPELEELADRFTILQKGEWAEVRPGQASFTRAELVAGFHESICRLECSDATRAAELLDATREGEAVMLRGKNREAVAAAVKILVDAGLQVYAVQPLAESLTEVTREALARGTAVTTGAKK